MRTRHPGMLVPLLPLSFVVGYQADMAWGGKMERIIGRAAKSLPGYILPSNTSFPPRSKTVMPFSL